MAQVNPGAPAPAQSHELLRLQAAIVDIDCLAQGGFSEISAIARLALIALETPEAYRHPEVIAQALSAIWSKADDISCCVSDTAGRVGCAYTDPNAARRFAAECAAHDAATSLGVAQ